MAVARHGTGAGSVLRALWSQVHPVFMLPPLAASLFGALLAPSLALGVAVVHVVAIFLAVYTAHVKDGYVDFHVRAEDDDHPLTVRGCRLALVVATGGFALCLAALAATTGPAAAAATLPAWCIGYLHAPQFDTNPVTATVGYPVGIGVAIASGHLAQAGALAARPLAFAGVFVVLLSGVKVIDDAQDFEYDRSIGKTTVAVALGRARARAFAHALMLAGLVGVLWFAVDGLFPPGSVLGAAAFGAVALVARRAGPELATKLLVRGAYVLLAVLVAVVAFRPLAGAPLPDVGVLGPYTYLATEVLFGSVALALLYRADALWTAARTLAVVYPVAYLWDWYTLEVGVFAIQLRTGVELVGIPLEEHLFILVVTGFVLGVHETVNGRERPE